MTSRADVLVPVAAVVGAHGVKGDVKLRSFTGDPEACLSYGPLYDAAGAEILEPVSSRQAGDHLVVTTRPVRSREDWLAMKGTLLHVPRSQMPETQEDEFYFDDLTGLTVEHTTGAALGKVKSVQNFGSDDLLEIVAPDGRAAYFIPFTKAAVPVVDLTGGRLIADPDLSYLPEALAGTLTQDRPAEG